MFDDKFDCDSELAILILEQYKLAAKVPEASRDDEEQFEARRERIGELLEIVSQQLPNWSCEAVPIRSFV